MVTEIRIHVEGGGGKDGKQAVRTGMGQFLSPLRQMARHRRIKWNVVACGSREDTFDLFRSACRNHHPNAFNLLLVDAEATVKGDPPTHLQACDGWDLGDVEPDRCHLMVQVMEAWLIADRDALPSFFGDGFRQSSLPGHSDVEQVDKADLLRGLERATRDSRKGRYHKIHHGPKILGRLDPEKVRKRARHCNRLFETLEKRISGTS